MLLEERAPDPDFLKRVYRQFVPYEQHWMRDRGGQVDGLFHYSVNHFTGVAKEDNQGIRFESGWDNSVRWDESVNLWTIDLNCFMCLCGVARARAEGKLWTLLGRF